jgi:WD40 repeat protein
MRIIPSNTPRPLNLIAFGPNGRVAAGSSTFNAPGEVEVWDATTGSLQWRWSPEFNPNLRAIAFVLDAQHLFVADSLGTHLLELLGGKKREIDEIARNTWREAAFAVSGDRNFVARSEIQSVVGPPLNRAALSCWRLPNFSLLWKDERWDDHTRFDVAPAIDPSGDRFALSVRVGGPRPMQLVSIRDANTGAQIVSVSLDPASPVQQLAFTADGSKLLVRTDDRKVQLFDAATGAPAGELVHSGRPYVTAIAVHPRGPVACARTNGTVTFWDVERREQLRTLDWKAGKLVSVAFAPDGALGAAGTEDGKLVVWDVDL